MTTDDDSRTSDESIGPDAIIALQCHGSPGREEHLRRGPCDEAGAPRLDHFEFWGKVWPLLRRLRGEEDAVELAVFL